MILGHIDCDHENDMNNKTILITVNYNKSILMYCLFLVCDRMEAMVNFLSTTLIWLTYVIILT